MKWIKNTIQTSITYWDKFWFKPIDTFSLSCFRFFFCSVLLIMYLIRFFDIKLFFYNSGLMTASSAKNLHEIYTQKALFFGISSDALLYFCYLAFIGILLLMALGAAHRLLAILAFILHLVFIQRNPSIVFGADMVATFWLFYLMFTKSNNHINWLQYFFSKKGTKLSKSKKGDWLSTIMIRFIQIQLCVIYMFSGLEKLRGNSWWEGTAIWEAFSFYGISLVNSSVILSLPLISSVLTIFTILFEIYFPVLVWVPKIRSILLILGFCFHLSIAICMNLYFFSFIMLSAYILFIPSDFLKKFFPDQCQ